MFSNWYHFNLFISLFSKSQKKKNKKCHKNLKIGKKVIKMKLISRPLQLRIIIP